LSHSPDIAALCAMHGEADPERLILRLCRELIDQCPAEVGPTQLKILGSLRGVRRYHSRPIHTGTGCSGLLVSYDGGYEITVHAGEPAARQNFSVAHEIVHTYFREACLGCLTSSAQERLCDIGAAELTMPSERFSTAVASWGLTLAGIDRCAAEFAVSFEAAARRSVSLTSYPACVLIAVGSARAERTPAQLRPDERQQVLQVVKSWRSRTWPSGASNDKFAIEPESLIAQAYSHQDQRHGRIALGIASRPDIYEIQARGYAYPLPGKPGHQQVVALVRTAAALAG